MEPALAQVFTTVGGWVVALILGLIAWLPKRGTVENMRIDQLQEDNKELVARVDKQDERADKQEAKLATLSDRLDAETKARRRAEALNGAWEIYHQTVVHGVAMNAIPPWPPTPTKDGEPNVTD